MKQLNLINKENLKANKKRILIVNTNTPFMEYKAIDDYMENGLSAPYHYFIKLNGDIQHGLMHNEHSDSSHNKNRKTITICWVGNNEEGMTEQQKLSIQMIVDWLDIGVVEKL